MRWAGHVASVGENRNAYTVLVEKPEGRRTHVRPRSIWDDDIKMDHISKMRKRGLDSCF
jgi:hypothetical protein